MPREFPRSRRVEEQIQRILSDVVRAEVRDPRLNGVIVSAVKVSRDLSVAWIYYSTLDAAGTVKELSAAFDSASGFLRRRLAAELSVRRVPELRFEFDDATQRGNALDELIETAVSGDSAASKDGDEIAKPDANT
jgi:ribosome-binding factor A